MIEVDRRAKSPESLAAETSWSQEDVVRALHEDFHGKCYLCERPLPAGAMEVDHRKPRNEHDDLRYEWTNLFPACRYCNGRRSPHYPVGGLLDPDKDRVESRLKQKAEVMAAELRCVFDACDPADAAAANTAQELSRLHSEDDATTYRSRAAARDLGDTVHDHYAETVYPLEVKILRARKRGHDLDADALDRLRHALGRRSPYTMLIRSLVSPDLAELFD